MPLTSFQVASQQHLILDDEEITGYSYKRGSTKKGGFCKVLIDKGSGVGMVQVASMDGYHSPQVSTSPGQSGIDELDIGDGQTCTVMGNSTVLYILYA